MIKILLELVAGSCTLRSYVCALHSPAVRVYATDDMENITFALFGMSVCIEQFFLNVLRCSIQASRWRWWQFCFAFVFKPWLGEWLRFYLVVFIPSKNVPQ
jgi:hypothetical protein